MTSDQIRDTFLRFFQGKGHLVVPSSSLIPAGDPTLLLTTAGMVQFKPYFTGEATPPSPRLTSCQKCFRTTDIDSAGDFKHLTFFEMLGNFSIGDYFKKEAIAWAWEFVTEVLGLPQDKLWITIFLDDDESFAHWRAIGVPAEKIARCGEKENFWGPAGETGPCGPCSEIHWDFGKEYGCGKPECGPACDCGRFLEIWNLVFTQFFQDAQGKRTPLPKPNIDTGMGLERTAAVMQGKHSFYEADCFAPFVQHISKLAGKPYGTDPVTDHAIRVVAEHGRAITFLIADGVLPSNEGRGYVLRRVLRRAALFGRKLGLDEAFLGHVAEAVVAGMGHIYPEIVRNRELVLRVISQEEGRFEQTLNMGLSRLEEVISQTKSRGEKVIPGEDVFQLHDTFGFLKEITAEVASEHGLSVDLVGFEAEMKRQRERARAAQKFGLGEKAESGIYQTLGIEETPFLGYQKLRLQTQVLALVVGGETAEIAASGQEVEVVLRETPFYGEMGGQVGDTGEIKGSKGRILISNTVRPLPELVVHQGKVAEGFISKDDVVAAEVDAARRLDIARSHTTTHLLQAALRRVLGSHVRQSGSLVAPERFRFDFSHLIALSSQELAEVQGIVNDKIRQNLVVIAQEMPYAQAIAQGAIALFGEKYGDIVRMVKVQEPDDSLFSAELCGGTHVARTGGIGFFHIVSETSIGSGMRRIEAVTGRGAEKFVSERFALLEGIAKRLEGSVAEVDARLSAVLAELSAERKRASALERELAKRLAESLLGKVESVDGISIVAARVPASSMESLRLMGDWLRDHLGSGVIVLGAVYNNRPNFLAMVTRDLVAKGLHAGEIVKQVAGVTGGSGGGRPEMAQAGGKDQSKLEEALKLVTRLVKRER